MKTVNVQEAKTHLSRLMEETMSGETIVLCKHGKPMIQLVPFEAGKMKRHLGGLESQIWIADDFDDEDEEIEQMFYGDVEWIMFSVSGADFEGLTGEGVQRRRRRGGWGIGAFSGKRVFLGWNLGGIGVKKACIGGNNGFGGFGKEGKMPGCRNPAFFSFQSGRVGV
jgi:prevent-host-death family protein